MINRKARESGAHPGRPRAAGLVGRVSAGQPHPAHRRCRQHHPPLERGDRRSRSIHFFWKRREIRWLPMPATAARISSVPVSPAIPLAPNKPTGRARPWPAYSAGGSQPCRAIIFPKHSSASILSGRRRRFPDCSRSDLRPTPPAPRCPSSASGRNRTAPRWCIFLSARQSDRCLMNRWPHVQPLTFQSRSPEDHTQRRSIHSESHTHETCRGT